MPLDYIGFVGSLVYFMLYLKKYQNGQGELNEKQHPIAQVMIGVKLLLIMFSAFAWCWRIINAHSVCFLVLCLF